MPLSDRPYAPTSQAASVAGQTALNVQASTVPGPLPATLVLTATTETVIPSAAVSTLPLQVVLPPDKNLEQKGFDLYFSGDAKTTANGTLTFKVYSGTSLTVGNDTLLATSGTITQNSADAPWEAHLHLIYSTVSGKLTGWFEFLVNNTIVARTALSNVVTGISNANNPVATFLLSVTSSGAASGTATTITLTAASVG